MSPSSVHAGMWSGLDLSMSCASCHRAASHLHNCLAVSRRCCPCQSSEETLAVTVFPPRLLKRSSAFGGGGSSVSVLFRNECSIVFCPLHIERCWVSVLIIYNKGFSDEDRDMPYNCFLSKVDFFIQNILIKASPPLLLPVPSRYIHFCLSLEKTKQDYKGI